LTVPALHHLLADLVTTVRPRDRRARYHHLHRNSFIAPFALIKSLEQMTLPIGVVALQGVFGGASLSVLMAATVMAVLPLLVVFLVAQRFISEDLTMTGIKG
jgi:ABC-type glycerol-3-phosphate transport system permease component